MDKEKLDIFLKNQEKEKEKERFYKIFVEIGPGGLALPTQGKFFKENEVYIGIDSNKTDLEISRNLSLTLNQIAEEKGKFRNKNIFFIIGDANDLFFEDNFVDEMFFGNVFGDGRLKIEAKRNFLKEASRVLKENGLLIIKETATPFSYDLLKKIAEEFNFREEKKIDARDEGFLTELSKYELKFYKSSFSSYISYFRKINKNI